MGDVEHLTLRIEFERETDGRWIADIIDYPGVTTYGPTKAEALLNAVNLLAAVLEKARTTNG